MRRTMVTLPPVIGMAFVGTVAVEAALAEATADVTASLRSQVMATQGSIERARQMARKTSPFAADHDITIRYDGCSIRRAFPKSWSR